MKVLLTGGAGFIGSNFVRLFAHNEFPKFSHLYILDKLTYAGSLENIESFLSLPNLTFIQGDILNKSLVSNLANSVDLVINMAAESHVDNSIEYPNQFVMTNIVGTQTLLDACLHNQVNKFLQVSTDEVYGSITSGSWDENSKIAPNSPYSASKASADLLVYAYHKTYGLNTVITRCTNNFGPNQYPEKIIPFFIQRLVAGKKTPIYGNGNQVLDWLYVDDHCRAIYIASLNGKSGEIYNIGGGKELKNIDLANMIIKYLGFNEDRIEYVKDRAGHDLRYSIIWEKIAQIGYKPKSNFDIQFNETLSWYFNKYSD
jgi:dTDP-glucose 4,6-dehydratase